MMEYVNHNLSSELLETNGINRTTLTTGNSSAETVINNTFDYWDQTFRNHNIFDLSTSYLENISMLQLTNSSTLDDLEGHCRDWKNAQHALFQLANMCLVISFLTPSSVRLHAYFLRLILSLGYVFLSLWAGLFICMLDIVTWSCVFITVNISHLTYLSYQIFPVRLPHETNDLYKKIFKPLDLSRKVFKQFVTVGSIFVLRTGTVYAKEGLSLQGEKLSILVKGRLVSFVDIFYNIFQDIYKFIHVSQTFE